MNLDIDTADLLATVATLERPVSRFDKLASLPLDGEPAEVLDKLASLLSQLGVNLIWADPIAARTELLERTIKNSASSAADAFRQRLLNISETITQTLTIAPNVPGPFLLTAHFHGQIVQVRSNAEITQPRRLAGLLRGLDADHWARGLMPTVDDFYRVDGEPAIVLGDSRPGIVPPMPWPWCWTKLCKQLTVTERDDQRRSEREREQEKRRKDIQEAEAIRYSTHGRIAALEAELRELKSAQK